VKHGRDEIQPQRQRYHCRRCGRYFDYLTGTIFEGHHQPLAVWMLCLYFMGLNLSNCQLAHEPNFLITNSLTKGSVLPCCR
jgi:transposase-like protein